MPPVPNLTLDSLCQLCQSLPNVTRKWTYYASAGCTGNKVLLSTDTLHWILRSSIVTARLDYSISLLYGIPQKAATFATHAKLRSPACQPYENISPHFRAAATSIIDLLFSSLLWASSLSDWLDARCRSFRMCFSLDKNHPMGRLDRLHIGSPFTEYYILA